MIAADINQRLCPSEFAHFVSVNYYLSQKLRVLGNDEFNLTPPLYVLLLRYHDKFLIMQKLKLL